MKNEAECNTIMLLLVRHYLYINNNLKTDGHLIDFVTFSNWFPRLHINVESNSKMISIS